MADDAEKSTLINNIPSSIKVGNRTIITSKPPRQWAWKSFTSSARHDSAKFFHWVRANIEYADYPYARFDVHLDPLTYTDEEYQKYLAMSEVEDLGETLPDFLTVGKEIKADSTTDESLFQQQLLQSSKILPWTKAETDVLMELCQNCDLRWPVIIDRWHMRFKKGTVSSLRKVEDLQYRYYQVGSILAQKRVVAEATKLSAASKPGADVPPPKDTAVDTTLVEASKSQPATSTAQQPLDSSESTAVESTLPSAEPSLSFPNTGTTNRGKMFDLVAERARRKQLDYIWNQSQEEAQEEAELRAELRAVEAQLRKLKKAGKHLVPSGSAMAAVPPPTEKATASTLTAAPASARPTATVVSATPADPFFHAHQEVDESFNETAPVPTPGTPYLQSGRLFPPNIEGHSKLKKSTLKQMDEILSELGVPKEPIATKRSCDLFDGVRKDAMTLLILQKMALKKEAELVEKKAKLERRKTGATTTAAQEKGEDETPEGNKSKKVIAPKGSNENKESSQNGVAGATTEKASKKKRKNPTPSATAATVVAPVVSQPSSNVSAAPATSTDAPQQAATITSSEPAATAPASVAQVATSSSLISQGKTTKAAGRKRVRKK
jgi:DNA methyltransferase 1-associated protein 1